MLFLIVSFIVSLLILNMYAEAYKISVGKAGRSSLRLASSKSGTRPEFLREINENKVLREKLADDEDSVAIIIIIIMITIIMLSSSSSSSSSLLSLSLSSSP